MNDEGDKDTDPLKCPFCDDVGWYPQQIGDDDWEQIQCEFCYTIPNSIFNLNNNTESVK